MTPHDFVDWQAVIYDWLAHMVWLYEARGWLDGRNELNPFISCYF